MNFANKPIIVEGVNHSGTRLIVQILSVFGSDGGDYNNPWAENKLYLKLHKNLIDSISDKGWTKTILNIEFIKDYSDNCEFELFIRDYLTKNIITEFPNYKSKAWHWKCPTSALFEKTWTKIYPEAWYIINTCEAGKVAKSFVRRNASLPFIEGLKFHDIMNNKIFSIKKKRQLIIDFSNIRNEIDNIANFVPFDVSEKKITIAKSLIKNQNNFWNRKWSFYMNLKNIYATFLYNKHVIKNEK